MRTVGLALPVLVAVGLPAQVDPDLAARIVEEGIGNSGVMAFQDHLCNQIGHRLTGSDNMTLACAWALEQFRAMGLEAELETWQEWKLVWNRGQWMGRVVAPRKLELQVATPAWSAPTRGQQRGRIVDMPADDAEVAALLATEGGLWLWGGRPGERSTRWERLQPLLDAGRVLGTVQSARSTGMTDRRYDNQIRVFGDANVARGEWEARPTVPQIVVRDDQAEEIVAMLDGGEPVIAEFEIRNRFRKGPIALTNVIAELVGSEAPDEVVIVCAHLDSWHQATGATDNGTGVCSTLECARILAAVGARPRRTIRFCLWTGEEQGLLGSRAYVVRHRQEMDRISAVFNHDSGTNWAHALTVTEAMRDDFMTVLAPVFALPAPNRSHTGATFELGATPTMRPAGGGSDHASFAAVGVPAWAWSLAGERPYGYGWHSQWDTFDIVEPDYQRHNAVVFALVALGVANLPHLLPRDGVGRAEPPRDATALAEARLGVELDGMTVTSVAAEGLAARAGVRPGDVLEEIDGRTVATGVDVWRLLRRRDPKAAMALTVKRGGAAVGLLAPAVEAAGSERPRPAESVIR